MRQSIDVSSALKERRRFFKLALSERDVSHLIDGPGDKRVHFPVDAFLRVEHSPEQHGSLVESALRLNCADQHRDRRGGPTMILSVPGLRYLQASAVKLFSFDVISSLLLIRAKVN